MFTVSALKGSGLPSLSHLRPTQVHRHCLREARFITIFSEVSTLEKEKEKEKRLNVHRQCLERLGFTITVTLETDTGSPSLP